MYELTPAGVTTSEALSGNSDKRHNTHVLKSADFIVRIRYRSSSPQELIDEKNSFFSKQTEATVLKKRLRA
jgi:hypothetical protein